MTDLSYRGKGQGKRDQWEPEEIAAAVLALVIWIPMAFVIGGLL